MTARQNMRNLAAALGLATLLLVAGAPLWAQEGAPAAPPVDDDPALEMAAGDAGAWTGPEAAADAASPSAEAAAKLEELRRNEFFYQSYGRGDPFKTLVAGKFEELASSDLVDVGSGRLVGVMWGPDDQFALVEDGNGFGYILRVGDPVQNGRVVSIRKNSLTAKITLYGITSTVTLKLEKAEG